MKPELKSIHQISPLSLFLALISCLLLAACSPARQQQTAAPTGHPSPASASSPVKTTLKFFEFYSPL